MGHLIGSVEVGKLADLVIWTPANFGTKPTMVIKSGMISHMQMGDPNASIPTVEPVIMRPMFATSVPQTAVTFVSQASIDNGTVASYHLKKRVEAVKHCRDIRKQDMKFNDSMPKMRVDPETYVSLIFLFNATERQLMSLLVLTHLLADCRGRRLYLQVRTSIDSAIIPNILCFLAGRGVPLMSVICYSQCLH